MTIQKSSRLPGSDLAGSRRVRNREATIHAVLESAQRLFSTKGYDRTSLVDIAAETGLSPRGVILHFSSKADIAVELMLRDLRARAQSFRGHSSAGQAAERILAFFQWLADADRRAFINFPALWAFSARWSAKVEATAHEAMTELLAPVRRAIEDGIESGELRRVDPAVACDILWTNYMAGLRRASIHGAKPVDAIPNVERALSLLRT
jgi:AcrR family transcriptional regulator